MQIGKARHMKICEDFWKIKEIRFKRPQKTFQRN